MPDGIAYQNKDILFKVLSQNYENKSFKVLGLNLPKIKKVLPTNLPKIFASELRADNIFLLEDGGILIVDYESSVKQENFIKYLEYILVVLRTYFRSEKKIYDIIVAVIYTGDIKTASSNFEMASLKLSIEQVFLSNFDTSEWYSELKKKVDAGEMLSDEDVMKFIVLPLTEPVASRKQGIIEKSITLAKNVVDAEQQMFIVAGILVATDKFIDKNYSNMIKEWIAMTKVARLYEEEKIEAVNEAVNEAVKDKARSFAKEMLLDNEDIVKIMKYSKLTRKEIKGIQEELGLIS